MDFEEALAAARGMRAKAPTIDQAARAAAEGAAVLEEIHLLREPATGRTRIEVVYMTGGQRCRAAASGTPRGDGHTLAELVKRDRPMPGLFASVPVFHVSPDYLWRVFVDLEFLQDGEARFEWNEIGQGEVGEP